MKNRLLMLRRALPALPLAIFVTCSAATQNAPSAAQPPKEATLLAEDVSLRTPIPVSIDGTERTVRELMELRVSAATRFPVRALDPVLVLGETRVTDYRYDNRDRTLIFTSYDPAKLRELAAADGVDAYVQYGDDEESRVALPRFRSENVKRVRR